MKIRFIILYYILLCAVNVYSQEKNVWCNYTYSQRVLDLEVSNNIVWVATMGGLVKYNSLTNKKEFYNRANANLPDNNLLSLTIDKDNNIWIGSKYYGIGKFSGTQCVNFNVSNSELPSNLQNTKIKVDKNNKIWVGSLQYIACYYNGSWDKWKIGDQLSSSFIINDLIVDDNDRVWLATSMGLGKLEKGKYSGYDEIIGPVVSLEYISKDKFWIGSQKKGLFLYDKGKIVNYTPLNSNIPTYAIYSMATDKDDNLWFPAGSNLVKFNQTEFIIYENKNNSSDLWILTIDIDTNNNVWCGTFDGNLLKFNNSNYEKIQLSNSPLKNNYVIDMVSNDHSIYISTNSNIVKKDNATLSSIFSSNNHISKASFSALSLTPYNEIWIGRGYSDICLLKMNSKDTIVFDSENSPFNPEYNHFRDIISDSVTTWFATNTGLYNYASNNFTQYNTENSNIPSNDILCLLFDDQNNIWGGTGNGLFKFDGSTWEILNVSNSAIPTNVVNSIAKDSRNRIWFSCMDENRIVGGVYGGGITRFENSEMQTFNMNNSSVPSNTIFDIYIDSSDDIWIGTYSKGLVKFNGINEWKIYDVFNCGLSHNDITKIIEKDDSLWIGHSHGGVSVVDLNTIDNDIRQQYIEHEKKNNSFELFPNPVRNSFYIKVLDSTIKDILIQSFDLTGRKLGQLKYNITTSHQQISITLSTLKIEYQGVYIIRLSTSEGICSKRIMVLKD